MRELRKCNWNIPIDKNFRIGDIIKRGGYYDIDGVWNNITPINGKLYRGRVEILILDEDNLFLKFNDDGTYRIPGGSFEKGVFNKDQAAAEAKEEARIICNNITYTGIHYIMNFERQFPQEPGKIFWSGTYNEVYVGEYESQYNGYLKDIDKDTDMYTSGKFYPLIMVYDKLKDPHKKALKPAMDKILSNMPKMQPDPVLPTNIEIQEAEVDNFFHLTSVAEGTIIDQEGIREKDKYYPYFTPEQMEKLGVFRESGNYYSDNAKIDDRIKEWYLEYKNSKDNSASIDWFTKVSNQYEEYENNPSNENKQILLSLGWNPEISFNMENIRKIADIRKKEIIPDKVIDLQENYIFSKKDNVYNFDKWEDGECNILFITGLSGSGKSTLAYDLAKEYGAKVINLDHIQCYERFCKENIQSDTTKLIKKYLKANKSLKVSDFNNILIKSFKDIYAEMFPWLIKELEKDKKNSYIVEGIHIMLFTKYEDIKDYPLICINTSMTKSIFRHWVRDQFTIKELLNYGLEDIKLFNNWEDQYNDFKDSIEEEYTLTNEVGVFKSVDSVYYNIDKLKPGTSNNILFVTGFSGAGKSTLSKELEDKYDNIVNLEADWFYVPIIRREKFKTKRHKIPKLILKYLDDNMDRLDDDITNFNDPRLATYFEEFLEWLYKETSKPCYNKYIFVVEGTQVFLINDLEFYKDKPIIIIGTSMIKSYIRKSNRDVISCKNWKRMKTLLTMIPVYIDNYGKINNLNKILNEEVIDEEYLEEKKVNKIVGMPAIISKYNKQHNVKINNLADLIINKYNPGFRHLISVLDEEEDLLYIRKDHNTLFYTLNKIKERINLINQLGECKKTAPYYKGIKKMYIDRGITVRDIDKCIAEVKKDNELINARLKVVRKYHKESVDGLDEFDLEYLNNFVL